MKQKSAAKLFFHSALVLLLLFSLVFLAVTKNGKFALLELIGLLVLLLLSVVGLSTYNGSGKNLLFLVFWLYLLNLLSILVHYHRLYLSLTLLAVVGLLTSIPHRSARSCDVKCGEKCGQECGSCCGTCQCGPEPMTSAPPQKVTSAKAEPKAAESTETAPAKTKFTRGK